MIPYILKSNSVSLFPAGAAPIIVDAGHMNFNAVVDAIVAEDWDEALELASVVNFVQKATKGLVSVDETGVTWQGERLTGFLADRMVEFFNEGLPIDHYCLFLENLMANPSMTSRNELYLFLEAANLPVTEDGCFLAYKAVRSDYKDKHSGTFDNSPGASHAMERRNVDDNRERTCSYGFHVAAYEYAKNFLSGSGDRMVACKVNPKDVVSVPSDYDNQKLRTCAYSVEFEIPNKDDIFKDVPYYDTCGSGNPRNAVAYFWGSIFDETDED